MGKMFNCMGESCWDCSPNQVALSIHIHERHIRAPGAHIYAQWTVRFERSEGVVVVVVPV
jgi:hypothetical protein